MAYDIRLALTRAPEPSEDGSLCVLHDIQMVYKIEDPEGVAWVPVRGRHRVIAIPSETLKEVLDEPTNGMVVEAYKAALIDNLHTIPEPLAGWDVAAVTEFLDNNQFATDTAFEANFFITQTLGLEYPVRFQV